MSNLFTRLTGINGRRIAMSATGAIVDKNGYAAFMVDASGVAQMVLKSAVEYISSSGAALVGYGMSVISSGTAASQNFTLAAPSSGAEKEIFSLSSATTILLETTATGIFFVSTGALSTAITFSGAAGQFGQSIVLRGISSARWAVKSKTAQIT